MLLFIILYVLCVPHVFVILLDGHSLYSYHVKLYNLLICFFLLALLLNTLQPLLSMMLLVDT